MYAVYGVWSTTIAYSQRYLPIATFCILFKLAVLFHDLLRVVHFNTLLKSKSGTSGKAVLFLDK